MCGLTISMLSQAAAHAGPSVVLLWVRCQRLSKVSVPCQRIATGITLYIHEILAKFGIFVHNSQKSESHAAAPKTVGIVFLPPKSHNTPKVPPFHFVIWLFFSIFASTRMAARLYTRLRNLKKRDMTCDIRPVASHKLANAAGSLKKTHLDPNEVIGRWSLSFKPTLLFFVKGFPNFIPFIFRSIFTNKRPHQAV